MFTAELARADLQIAQAELLMQVKSDPFSVKPKPTLDLREKCGSLGMVMSD